MLAKRLIILFVAWRRRGSIVRSFQHTAVRGMMASNTKTWIPRGRARQYVATSKSCITTTLAGPAAAPTALIVMPRSITQVESSTKTKSYLPSGTRRAPRCIAPSTVTMCNLASNEVRSAIDCAQDRSFSRERSSMTLGKALRLRKVGVLYIPHPNSTTRVGSIMDEIPTSAGTWLAYGLLDRCGSPKLAHGNLAWTFDHASTCTLEINERRLAI